LTFFPVNISTSDGPKILTFTNKITTKSHQISQNERQQLVPNYAKA